jgi:hypothetical protein
MALGASDLQQALGFFHSPEKYLGSDGFHPSEMRLSHIKRGFPDGHSFGMTQKPYFLLSKNRPKIDFSAVASIDASATPGPLAYLVNCTHASSFKSALLHEVNSSSLVRKRVIGLLANTAALSPEELDNSVGLVEEEPE